MRQIFSDNPCVANDARVSYEFTVLLFIGWFAPVQRSKRQVECGDKQLERGCSLIIPTGTCVGETGDLPAHLSGGRSAPLKRQRKTAFILEREVFEILLGRSNAQSNDVVDW